jgi:hypothetical protein
MILSFQEFSFLHKESTAITTRLIIISAPFIIPITRFANPNKENP